MGRYITFLLFVLSLVVPAAYASAEDLAGLTPAAPYGIFSTLIANSPAQGHSAVSFGIEKSVRPDYYRFSSSLAMGITDNMEAGLTIPYIDNGTEGLEDVTVSFKHRFLEETPLAPSMAYLVTAALDTGVEGGGTGGSAGGGVVITKRAGPFRGHMNLLYSVPFDRDYDDEARFSAGIDFSAANNFKILGEFLMRKSFSSDRLDQQEVRFGYRFIYDEGIFSTLGVGMNVGNAIPTYRFMASISVLFPRVEHIIEKVYEEGN